MKKLIFILLSFMFVQYCYSQENVRERIERDFRKYLKSGEFRVNEDSYQVDTFNTICGVSNKNAIDYKTSSNVDMDDPSYKTSFDSMEILTEVFEECMSGKLDVDTINSRDNIRLMMVSDLSGTITKVSFIYEHRLNISIELIGQIEKVIKKKCRLNFDKNAKAFLHAKYVECTCTIFLQDILSVQ